MGKLRGIVISLFFSIAAIAMARERTCNPNTGNTRIDTILMKINREFMLPEDTIIDHLSTHVYIKGTSKALTLRKITKYFTNILPFEAHKDRITAVEAICKVSYQNPSQFQYTPIEVRTNSKRGVKILREAFQVLLPIYSFKRMKDNGSDKSYVIPFSNDGLSKYEFDQVIDTVIHNNQPHIKINYRPLSSHHTLGTGYMIVDMSGRIKTLQFSGRVDFGKVNYMLTFGFNNAIGKIIPEHNHILINYTYSKTTGVNEYDCYFSFDDFSLKKKISKRYDKLDLTDIYDQNDYDKVAMYYEKPTSLTHEEDSLLSIEYNEKHNRRQKRLFEQLPERLVSSSRINAFGNDLKIYGPLDPSSFSYDKRDGFTIRQRLRFSRLFENGKSFMLKPDIGYSFGMKELRYKISGEWIYNPRKRGGISISASNRSSEFSSKFENSVNEVLKDTSSLTFDDLGIEYYRRHEIKLEHSTEITNGLMFYVGATYNYRDPVKYGSRKMSQEQIKSLVNNYYADFNPYLRLTWTPRQYYYYQNNQKLYTASYYPTFSLEIAHGVKNFFGSTSDYRRIEFDIHQSILLDNVRSLSYHIGSGAFFRQKGEYFISYSFFSRRMFPATWDDHIGGTFNLLEDYWYNSTPGYCQSHIMYETPFLLFHSIRPVSKYIIKERVYLSNLWADGKNAYSELGYGIGNNYFNLGLFASFVGLEINEVGIKATIEIDSHL